jgi:hypothetical protein
MRGQDLNLRPATSRAGKRIGRLRILRARWAQAGEEFAASQGADLLGRIGADA